VSYAAVGAIAGGIGSALISSLWSGPISTLIAWSVALVMLFSAVRVWPRKRQSLIQLRKPGRGFKALMQRVGAGPLALGGLTVTLPCAALWSGIAIAAASTSIASATLAMLIFCLASSAGLLVSSWLLSRTQDSRVGARIFALILVAGALLCVWRPAHFSPEAPATEAGVSCPLHPEGM
jgi:sulfite exporter TauE/SafE